MSKCATAVDCHTLDYIEQADGIFFFPATGHRVNARTRYCSCDVDDCIHWRTAFEAMVSDFVHRIEHAEIECMDSLKRSLLDLLQSANTKVPDELNGKARRILADVGYQCDQCGLWYSCNDGHKYHDCEYC